jgi:bacillithiol biosynthesis cysteine-adding enzyme BshC
LSFAKIPHATPLFLDYLHDFPKVSRFYRRPPDYSGWASEEARSIRYDAERRERVSAVLERQNRVFGASEKTLAGIARLRAGACAVVTGQQVGLLGGPLFSVLKAVSAVRIADEVRRGGHDCVPVFWLATEDHDFAEVSHVSLPSNGTLRVISTASGAPAEAPISDVQLGPDIVRAVGSASELLGDTQVTDWLRDSYRPGERMGTAFARLFARAFAEFGVVLLDASDPELHSIAEPIYRAAILGAAHLDEALLARGTALRAAGYHEQVKVTQESTALFAVEDGRRLPVHRANGEFTIGGPRLSAAELLARINDDPARFSGNVLLRPVVQDFLLPTIAYVGGAAEVAYFAQVAVLYEELLGRVTPVLPRLSATLVEPKIKRVLDKYGLALADIFQPPEQVRELLALRSLPGDLQLRFEHAADAIQRSMTKVRDSLAELDRTLVEASVRAQSKMRYQLERLRGRAARAELRRHHEIEQHAEQLCSALYPRRNLAEREIAAIYSLARHGAPLLHSLCEVARPDCHDHQVIYL